MIRHRWYSHDNAVRRTNSGAVVAVPKNYAVPRTATLVQHAHTAHEAIVFQTLLRESRDLVGKKGKALGKVCMLSEPKIAAACVFADGRKGMPVATCRKVLRSLIAKHSVIQWDVGKANAEPRRRGDHGGITAWRIPSYDDILAARRADPAIGRVGNKMFVIGKGRRFLTPEELASWQIDEAAVDRAGVRAMAFPAIADVEMPATIEQPSAQPERVARGRPAEAKAEKPPPQPAEDLEPIRGELARWCEAGASDADALYVLESAREINPAIPVEGIAAAIDATARGRRKAEPRFPFVPGFFGKRRDGKAGAMLAAVMEWGEKERKQKLEAVKQARWDRRHRVDKLAQYMDLLDYPEEKLIAEMPGVTRQDLAYWRSRIEEAAPDERAEAAGIYARSKGFKQQAKAAG